MYEIEHLPLGFGGAGTGEREDSAADVRGVSIGIGKGLFNRVGEILEGSFRPTATLFDEPETPRPITCGLACLSSIARWQRVLVPPPSTPRTRRA